MVESSFINLCDFSNEDNPSLLDVVVLVCVNFQLAKKQPLHLDVPQCCQFAEGNVTCSMGMEKVLWTSSKVKN
jgi:hypothetical protein